MPKYSDQEHDWECDIAFTQQQIKKMGLFKGYLSLPQKYKILSLITLMLFKTRKTVIHLRIKNVYIFYEIQKLSDPFCQLCHFTSQNHSQTLYQMHNMESHLRKKKYYVICLLFGLDAAVNYAHTILNHCMRHYNPTMKLCEILCFV